MQAPFEGRRRGLASAVVIAAGGALGAFVSASGAAGASAPSIHLKVTSKTITISGSALAGGGAAAGGDVVQVNADTRKCAAWTKESTRKTPFTDLHPAKAGTFTFKIVRKGFTDAKPRPHYACAYLLVLDGSDFKALASTSHTLK